MTLPTKWSATILARAEVFTSRTDNDVRPPLLNVPTGTPNPGAVRSRTGLARLSFGIFFAAVAVFAPSLGTSIALLPARLAEAAPSDKVTLLAIFAALAAVVSFLSILTFGTISDRTRGRFGKRNPWVLIGGVVSAGATILLAFADSVPSLGAGFLLQAVGINIVLGALTPVIPDRVPSHRRGVVSTALGAGTLIGGTVGVVAASAFAPDHRAAFLVLAVVALVLTVAYLACAPDFSNRDEPVTRRSSSLLASISFPRNAPDFYWAFFGRLGVILGYYTVGALQFFVLSEHLGLDEVKSAQLLGTAAVVNLIGSLVGALSAGPLSDLIHRRKAVTVASAIIIGVGVVIPALVPEPLGFLVYTGIAGLGLGMFFSVDAALLSELLPSEDSRGKDLGLLALATNAGQLLGPLAGAAAVGTGMGFSPVFVIALVFCVVGGLLLLPIRSVK
ncbi:MFS transporter [Rathayibacter sp. VKM Ac-2803]|uniref:MFS transporter n=1 Tax=Rathayibacter sp. VKM Ac-2803 TaxID=2609256 RepID=UPI001F1FD2B8|nr:MFS transporter [Rathayibacter sp. VKM Ac-2803]